MKGKDFKAYMMLEWEDTPVDVCDFNGKMAISTAEGPIIITKEQVLKFFDIKQNPNRGD